MNQFDCQGSQYRARQHQGTIFPNAFLSTSLLGSSRRMPQCPIQILDNPGTYNHHKIITQAKEMDYKGFTHNSQVGLSNRWIECIA